MKVFFEFCVCVVNVLIFIIIRVVERNLIIDLKPVIIFVTTCNHATTTSRSSFRFLCVGVHVLHS